MTEQAWHVVYLLHKSALIFTEEQQAAILAAHAQCHLAGDIALILLKPYVMPQLTASLEDEHDQAA